jgi:UDP-N-acetylmuramoyl-tripeptide--D-alanyl-D-alanine ligase
VAIAGERHDGHDFVGEALERGARGVVVAAGRGTAVPGRDPEPVVVEVQDTTEALQRMGNAMRRKSDVRLVAITGSAGKTTTKEVAAAVLSLRHRTFRNRGNLNNHIGLPLSLLEMGREAEVPELAVVELGMSAPGEIRTLIGIAEPDVRVWTNVAEAHLEHFPSVEAIADAKAEILEGAGPDSVLVANAGDPRVMARISRFPGHTVTFDLDRRADISATRIESRGIRGMVADTSAGRSRSNVTVRPAKRTARAITRASPPFATRTSPASAAWFPPRIVVRSCVHRAAGSSSTTPTTRARPH